MTDKSEPHLPPTKQIDDDAVRRAWRIVCWAGLLGSIYYQFCILGAPRNKWLVDLGARAKDFGLIAGAGALAIAFQILGAHLTNLVVRRKLVWMSIT
ncbi:MAG: hypothetical protein ACPL7D_06290, partial [Candidatus Sumerlaeaceae bacterium]